MHNQIFLKLKVGQKKKNHLIGRGLLKLLNQHFVVANKIKEIKTQRVKIKVHKRMH